MPFDHERDQEQQRQDRARIRRGLQAQAREVAAERRPKLDFGPYDATETLRQHMAKKRADSGEESTS